jgi:hypothetical protein
MERPLLLLAAIAALGAIYVVLPVMMDAFLRYRKHRKLTCPEEKRTASVGIDAKAAAWGAAMDKTQLRVRDCSLWPEKHDCAQRCLEQVA